MSLNKKNLIFMRHADSLPALNDLDINRELSPKGIAQAKEAAVFLAKFNIDKLLVSPSVRTRQTLNILNQDLAIKNVEVVEEIYKDNERRIIEIISEQPSHINNLMIIGHNPSICSTAFALTKTTDKGYEHLMQILMPPATIVVVDKLEIKGWAELYTLHQGCITDIFVPLS